MTLISAQTFIKWEVPVLMLISLTAQMVLVPLSNRRRYSRSKLLDVLVWVAYMAADAVATFALSVISTNVAVSEALHSKLDPRNKLQIFWAPFFLLHLGGPDTITAYMMEDNNLWGRQVKAIVSQTGLTLYILFKAWRASDLRALSTMMFAAGFIKYAERTWCFWTASYEKRRGKAQNALTHNWHHVSDDRTGKEGRTVMEMFHDTERMFADVLVKRRPQYTLFVRENSSYEVMRLIEIELEMMYDNLYTKARVVLSCIGLAFRIISFLLICITLILFSSSDARFHGASEYSLTYLLFAVSIGLELYAAFIFLTLYRTTSRIREHKMDGVARIMENLRKLRSRSWSNYMMQASQMSFIIRHKQKGVSWINKEQRRVPDTLKQFIHNYLKKAYERRDTYSQRKLLLVQSKGRVPWYDEHNDLRLNDHKTTLEHLFNKEFGEMIVFLHLVTEVCYYIDRPVFADHVDSEEYKTILDKSRFSKYLSRYLMYLFIFSSDLLPQRTPQSKMTFYDLIPSFQTVLPRGGGGEGVGGRGKRIDEKKRREIKEEICRRFWERPNFSGSTSDISDLQFALDLLKVMMPYHTDVSPPQPQLKGRWELLSEVWVELLLHAADQCKGMAHGQHLRRGGELLTHVWVLLGHFGFIDEALLPFKTDHDDDIETG